MFLFTKHILLSLSAFFIELGYIYIYTPALEQLCHVTVMGRSVSPLPEQQHQQHGNENNSALFTGAGLPQCPEKVVTKIQSEDFVDMSEVLPD